MTTEQGTLFRLAPDYITTTLRLQSDYMRGQNEVTSRLHSDYTRGQRLHSDYTRGQNAIITHCCHICIRLHSDYTRGQRLHRDYMRGQSDYIPTTCEVRTQSERGQSEARTRSARGQREVRTRSEEDMKRGQDEIRTRYAARSGRDQNDINARSGRGHRGVRRTARRLKTQVRLPRLRRSHIFRLHGCQQRRKYFNLYIRYPSDPQRSISQVLGRQVASQMIQTVGNDLVGCMEGACDPMRLIPATHDAFHVIQGCLALLHLSGNHVLRKTLLMDSLQHRTWSTILVKDQVIDVTNILEVNAAAIAAKAYDGCNCQSNAVGLFLPMLPQDLKKKENFFHALQSKVHLLRQIWLQLLQARKSKAKLIGCQHTII